jgi:flagella basal body P-ring formation protein FlgA
MCNSGKVRRKAAGIGVLVMIAVAVFGICPPPPIGWAEAAQDAVIHLSATGRVDGEEMRLGDLAHIEGHNPRWVRELQGLVVGSAPLPGRSRVITRDYVMLRLRQFGLETDRIAVVGADRVKVHRRGNEIDMEKLRSIVAEYFRKNAPWPGAEVRVQRLQVVSADRMLPVGRVRYFVEPPAYTESPRNLAMQVRFEVDGNYEKEIRIFVDLEVMAPAVVVRRPVGRGKPLDPEDVGVEIRNLADLPGGILGSVEAVLGQRATRNLYPDTVLRTDMIEIPPLVKRGDAVVIVAESEGLKITAAGEVKSAGGAGDRVQVVNLGSRKRIHARVVDQNTVAVDF